MSKIEPTMDLGEAAYHEGKQTLRPTTDQKNALNYPDETWKIASHIQVGGNHYTKLEIQPMAYSMANKLNALQHTALKYITRYPDKGTPLEDLAKARHCIDMMIEDWMDNHYEEDI
tara:strand:+ start:11 stop:358 length:348 start_codon:yes stop_codon:yes gene_type:complete